jgi:hypothetical protein
VIEDKVDSATTPHLVVARGDGQPQRQAETFSQFRFQLAVAIAHFHSFFELLQDGSQCGSGTLPASVLQTSTRGLPRRHQDR